MCIPYTHNSKLKKEMEKTEDKFNGNERTGKIRILERLGPTVKDSISKPYPWKGNHCG